MRAPAKGETDINASGRQAPTQVKFMAVSEGWELHPRKVLILKFWRGTACSDLYKVVSQLPFSAVYLLSALHLSFFCPGLLSLCFFSLRSFPALIRMCITPPLPSSPLSCLRLTLSLPSSLSVFMDFGKSGHSPPPAHPFYCLFYPV